MNLKFNLIYPLLSLNNWAFFIEKKIFIFRLNYLKNCISNFKLIKLLSNLYFIKLKKCLKKSHSKTRSFINKSNKKPWKQKGLGKARAGTYKSPLWKGGGSVFGPIKRNIKVTFLKKLNKLIYLILFLNKRTNILILQMNTNIHIFKSFKDHIHQQLRLKGIFSNKIIFISIILNKLYLLDINFIPIVKQDSKNILLNSDYIIFLI